jgi:hypothetical protein
MLLLLNYCGAMNIIGTAYPTVGTMNAALRSHSKTLKENIMAIAALTSNDLDCA